jgi:hypothetical protein
VVLDVIVTLFAIRREPVRWWRGVVDATGRRLDCIRSAPLMHPCTSPPTQNVAAYTFKVLYINMLRGGRYRTRTYDLVRVKHAL